MTEVHMTSGDIIIAKLSWRVFNSLNLREFISLTDKDGKEFLINGKQIVVAFPYEEDADRGGINDGI